MKRMETPPFENATEPAFEELRQRSAEVKAKLSPEDAAVVERIEWLVMHDETTGLYNERGFDDAFLSIMKQPLLPKEVPPGGKPRHEVSADTACLLLFDLDGMKEVNDLYGHDVGNVALKAVAEYWRQHTREDDIVARLHGDEFAILFRGATAAEIMSKAEFRREIAGEIRTIINFPVDVEGETFTMTASGGIIDIDTKQSVAELKRKADEALYISKYKGRDRVTQYEAAP